MPDTLPPGQDPTHNNLNDGTSEGMAIPPYVAFSVQYHPEAAPGPHDASYLFDQFIRVMETWKTSGPSCRRDRQKEGEAK